MPVNAALRCAVMSAGSGYLNFGLGQKGTKLYALKVL
jgi:hypothetical protein